MIDRDLAELYGVKTYRLNEAVKRNIKRFPSDFMFKLNDNELKEFITNCDRLQSLKRNRDRHGEANLTVRLIYIAEKRKLAAINLGHEEYEIRIKKIIEDLQI